MLTWNRRDSTPRAPKRSERRNNTKTTKMRTKGPQWIKINSPIKNPHLKMIPTKDKYHYCSATRMALVLNNPRSLIFIQSPTRSDLIQGCYIEGGHARIETCSAVTNNAWPCWYSLFSWHLWRQVINSTQQSKYCQMGIDPWDQAIQLNNIHLTRTLGRLACY